MKKGRLSDDFINLTTKLMMARERGEIIHIAADFNSVIEKLIEAEKRSAGEVTKTLTKSVTTTLKFTKQEISKMATTFKKEFIANGLAARVTKRESGKRSYCYEIRYRSNGYNISASSNDLAEAKRKFLAKTVPGEIEKYRTVNAIHNAEQETFSNIFAEFYKYKSTATILPKTLKGYLLHFLKIPQIIKDKDIKQIKTSDIAEYMKTLSAREYEEMRTMFNSVFKYAVANGRISYNPMGLIPFKRAKRQNREALSKEEIIVFLERVLEPKFDKIRQRAYFYYFFGLRASELDEETHREGSFLITRNRKRKNGLIEYKKIPIPKAAEQLIKWDEPLYQFVRLNTAGELFHELLGEDKSAYNLRHTFATICQQYVRPDIVDIWMGDSPDRLVGRVYTHFPDEFMRKQMDLVIFPNLETL